MTARVDDAEVFTLFSAATQSLIATVSAPRLLREVMMLRPERPRAARMWNTAAAVNLRVAFAFAIAVATLSCHPPQPVKSVAQGACDGAKRESCEASLASISSTLEAPSPEAVARARVTLSELDRVTPSEKLVALFDELRLASPSIPVVTREGARCTACENAKAEANSAGADLKSLRVTWPSARITPHDLRLLAGIAKLASVSQLLVEDDSGFTQVFAADRMSFAMAGAAPRIRVAPDRLGAAVTLAARVERAFGYAADGDYLSAAETARSIEEVVRGLPDDDEPATRARDALGLLSDASLTYDLESEADATSPAREPAPPVTASAPSSAYAALSLARTSRRHAPEVFERVRPSLLAELAPERLAVLDATLSKSPPCIELSLPRFESVADLLALPLLARGLAPTEGHEVSTGVARLPLREWLTHYDAALDLVLRAGVGWHAATSLLAERGLSGGLTARQSKSWGRVSALARTHVAALRRLVLAKPERVRIDAVASVALQPGTTDDPALEQEVARLVSEATMRRIGSAADPERLLSISLLAGALSFGLPPQFRGSQLDAAARAVESKLKGDLAQARGWNVALLHSLTAAARFALSEPDAFAQLPERLEASLDAPDLAHPSLGRLAQALVRYVELGFKGELDLENGNPRRMSAHRAAARDSLARSLALLGNGQPRTPPEEDVFLGLTEFGDSALAVAVALAREPRPEGGCATSPVSRSKTLTDALDRSKKHRRLLLKLPKFNQGDSPFLARARLVTLLLSDFLDLVGEERTAASTGRSLTFSESRADEIASAGLEGWLDGPVVDALRGGYQLWRLYASKGSISGSPNALAAARKITHGLRRLFESPDGSSLFQLFDDALGDALPSPELARALSDDPSPLRLVVALAERAYASGSLDQGDLLLVVASALDGASPSEADGPALSLAAQHQRPVALALLSQSRSVRGGKAPERLERAVRAASLGTCNPPDFSDVLDLERSLSRFRSGDRERALAELRQLLARAEARGLSIPRQLFEYRESSGRWVFQADIGLSLDGAFVRNASALNLGVGVESAATRPRGKLASRLVAKASAQQADEHALRHYAHLGVLTSVLARLGGDHALASEAARKSAAAYLTGARLGGKSLTPGPDGASWPSDAASALAIAAQQAVDAGEVFLAGQLWGLVVTAVGPSATDVDSAKLTRSLPPELSGLSELTPVLGRTARSVETLLTPLACTNTVNESAKLANIEYEDYPSALSLRIADALPALPRFALGKSSSDARSCRAYRALDAFLGPLSSGTYEPSAFNDAIEALRRDGHLGDAAAILAQHRRPEHCSPAIVEHARALAREASLGVHLRADVLSAAVNCARDSGIDDDVVLLDELTSRHSLPARNFEVLLHAALRARDGRPRALVAITHLPGFVERWRRVSPDLGVLALLGQVAAERLSGAVARDPKSAPTYEHLCAEVPSPGRTRLCETIEHLGRAADDPTAPTRALELFIEASRSVLAPPPTGGATP